MEKRRGTVRGTIQYGCAVAKAGCDVSQDALINKLRRLAKESPYEGERAAAAFALERMGECTDGDPVVVRKKVVAATLAEQELAACVAWFLNCKPYSVRRCDREGSSRVLEKIVIEGEQSAVAAAVCLYQDLRGQLHKFLKFAGFGFVWGVFPQPPQPPDTPQRGREMKPDEEEAVMFGELAGQRIRPAKLLPGGGL